MKTSQKRAIWYADRERKLRKIEQAGLMQEYLKYKGDSRYHKIETFCKKNGIKI